MKTKTYSISYLAVVPGHKKTVKRVFNTTARRALASKEIVSRAKKHAAENAGEMADCAVAVESIY